MTLTYTWHQPVSKSTAADANGMPEAEDVTNEEDDGDINANNEAIDSYDDVYDDAYDNDDMGAPEDNVNEDYGEDDEYMVDYD